VDEPRIIALGIDPDTTNTGIGLVYATMAGARYLDHGLAVAKGESAMSRRIGMAASIRGELDRLTSKHSPVHVFSVEWQGIRPGDPRPDDVCQLNAVAGMSLAALVSLAPAQSWAMTTFLPLPVQWKGSVPKNVHQPRVLAKLGLTKGFSGLGSRESHVVDALGLAAWAANEWLTQQRIRAVTGR
jgi:Holliday junction resolvasome RuvABC endonuclease subunit